VNIILFINHLLGSATASSHPDLCIKIWKTGEIFWEFGKLEKFSESTKDASE